MAKRTTKLLLYLFLFQVSFVVSIMAANQPMAITFSKNKISYAQFFNVINKQTGLTVFYNNELLNDQEEFDVSFNNTPLNNVLNNILDKKGVSWQISNQYILLQKSAATIGSKELASAKAVQQMVKGVVKDNTGETLPGASVVIQGKAGSGVMTDMKGAFQIAASKGTVLVVSFIGFKSQNVVVQDPSKLLNVVLLEDGNALDEVVVTALGISRAKKSLGYAAQDLKSGDLSEVPSTGLVSALSGKVSGVQITSSSGAPGSSSRMQIRGPSSIGSNNQPLFVVDGVPIDNGSYSSSTLDYGNGASSINPDDVESMSVLKGPAASALYGSRGANGVVIITTKSGKGSQGIGVQVNSSASFEKPFRLPDYQNTYGQGTNFLFEFVDGKGGGINDAVDESWGPKLDGRLLPQFDSPLDASGKRIPTPWIAHPDNVKNFYETGSTISNNVALVGGNDKGDFRLSYNKTNVNGILPNTNYYKDGISLNAGYKFTSKFSARATVNYVKDGSDNRANSGGTFIWFGRQVNLEGLRDYLLPGSIDQYNWNYNYSSNPFYSLNESTRANLKDRVYGNIALTYEFSDKLNLMVRTGTDFFTDHRKNKTARFNATRFGSYGEEDVFVRENNTDFILSYSGFKTQDFSLSANFGGNHRTNFYQRNYMFASELAIPNVFNMGNSRQRPVAENFYSDKEVNSLYGSAQMSYKDFIYLDLTVRNDWSSTLPIANNSYFYPGASLSVLVPQDFLKQDWIDLLKFRGSVAKVGNDTDPYRLRQTYNFEQAWGDRPTVSIGKTLLSANLKPELTNSFELGMDVSLFKRRLNAAVTYYQQKTKNQILDANISTASGFKSVYLNAGAISNKGIEIQLSGKIFDNPNGFKWESTINYSKNKNKVLELAEGLYNYQLGTYQNMGIEARVGESYGTFFGTTYLRSPDGQIVHKNGLPQTSTERSVLGSFVPDWVGGFSNVFTYKNISLHTLIDVKWGGSMYSYNIMGGRYSGVLAETAEGRDEGIVGEGVMWDGAQYVPNNVRVAAENYWHSYSFYNNNEAGIADATYIKLREVKLSYNLPKNLFGSSFIKNAKIGVYGRNLALLYSNLPHLDPESSLYGSASNVQGIESGQLTSTRSIGMNLSFGF